MRQVIAVFCAITMWAGAGAAGAAEPMKLMTIEFAPIFGIKEEGKPLSGFSVEVIQELGRRVTGDTKIEILPVARLQEVATTTPNVLTVVTLTEWRRPLYTWIAEEASDRLVVATPRGKRVVSLDALPKDVELGVLISSTMEKMAREKGFTNVSAVKAEASNLAKLQEGRIGAWLSYASLIQYEAAKAGVAADTFEYSDPVDVVHLYLVTSKDTPEAVYAPYRDAFAAMRKDGGYDAILAKYKGMIQPPTGN